MALELKKRDILNSYNNIISIGYCDAYYLLRGQERVGYTCGVYGWNADVYVVDGNTCIVTGYRPFGNIHASYSGIVKKYNEKARKIDNDYSLEWDKRKRKINKVFDKFIKECLENKEV